MRIAFADDAGDAEKLAELINRVYAVAEKGLWIDGAQRTDAAEVSWTSSASGTRASDTG